MIGTTIDLIRRRKTVESGLMYGVKSRPGSWLSMKPTSTPTAMPMKIQPVSEMRRREDSIGKGA